MRIEITRKTFRVKRISRIANEPKFKLYNIFGLGLWIYK